MIELKNYQLSAVAELKKKIYELIDLDGARQKLVFKAPTGAGKTVMASALLDEVAREIDTAECHAQDVVYIWIAPNKLHIQSYLSMRNFFKEKRSLNPIMFEDIDVNEGLKNGDVLFLNWESINKENAILIRDNETNRTLGRVTGDVHKKGIPIIAIIDEEHMFSGRNAKQSERILQKINPKVELRISATPTTQSYQAVEIPRKRVVEEEMIKKGIELNPHVGNSESKNLTVNQQLLEKALKKRNDLAKIYKAMGSKINPLLLIQLPNDSSAALATDEKRIVDEVKSYLDVYKDINAENGKLAVWLSNEKENLANLSQNDNLAEVLIFKQAIAMGWDCPRAIVLLIFREMQSQTFSIQTVGRILRMPEQSFYEQDELNYGYVYTNLNADKILIEPDSMNYISTIFANIRENLHNIKLPSVYQNTSKQPPVLGSDFPRFFAYEAEKILNMQPTTLYKAPDFYAEETDIQLEDNTELNVEEIISSNLENAKGHGIKTEVKNIFKNIPKDVKITDLSQVIMINDHARLALTQNEIRSRFNVFCTSHTQLFKRNQAGPMIKKALLDFMEEYLGKDENQAQKIVIYKPNRPVWEDIIAKVLRLYLEKFEKDEASRNKYVYKNNSWIVPETRMYNLDTYESRENDIFNHAIKPFFEQKQVSGPEYNFARFLDKQNEIVDWWYKNGDSGSENFAIPYTDKENIPRCFYVDFIIRLKGGVICLFDTKSAGSDPNSPEKHNALIDYMNEQNKLGRHLVGGIVVWDNKTENWYYPELKIDTSSDITGWTRLDLNTLNKDLSNELN